MTRTLPTRQPLKTSSDKIREVVSGGGNPVTPSQTSSQDTRKTSRLTANIRADLMTWLRGEALKEAAANPDAKNTTTIRDMVEEAIQLLQAKRK